MEVSGQKSLKVIRQLFYTLFFVTPLVLWPFTSEVFEFNKMFFVYLMTILIATTWAVRAFSIKKFEIAKTPLDLPIILFLISQIISTIISINPHTSMWGYYSRFHGGLMSTVSYITLYYALVTHFTGETKAIKNLITSILSSAAIISIYAVLEKMGIDKNIWVQDVQNRVFSTLGQPNWLSAFLIALLPLSLSKATTSNNPNQRLIYIGLSVLYLLAIIFTKSQSGIAATAVVLTLFFTITAIQKKKTLLLLALIPALALAVIFKGDYLRQTLNSLNKINPLYSDTLTILTEENKTRVGGSDSMSIRRVVWEGAIKLGLSHPFFGTGVETFGYSYYWVRPATHNLTSESDFLYNKAHNEYLNFFATTGFVGLFTYLLLIGSILYIFLNKKSAESDLKIPLLLGFISILITNYFGFSVVNIALFFFLYPAILLASTSQAKVLSKRVNLGSFGITIAILIALWALIGLRKAWLADIAYNKGKANLEESQRAVKLNPKEPIYYAQLGSVNSLIVTQLIMPQIASLPATASAETKAQAQEYLQKYLDQATENIKTAHTLNPYNLNILKNKAKVELSLATLDPKYYQDALNTLLKITEYSPTEANNYLNVGILYKSLGNAELATKAFERALELNPNLQAAKDHLQAK